jgi:hypothetical protein
MEQQNVNTEVLTNEVSTKVVVKKTIPQKQKTTIKLVMWALSHVMEREAMLVKIDEIFKLKDTSIEAIIEMVDAVEKSTEYLVMDTELGALRQKEKSRKEKVTGDPDTIIKQLVDMAKEEVKPAKKTKKATADTDAATHGTETEVKEKKPRAKKAVAEDAEVKEKKPRAKKAVAEDAEVKEKKPRAKKTKEPEHPSPTILPNPDVESDENVVAVVEKAPETAKASKKVTAEDKKKPNAKKEVAVAPTFGAPTEGAVAVAPTEGGDNKKKPKPRAKKVAVEDGSVVEEDKPKAKPKAKAKEEVPVVVHEVEESLEEDEYLLLNEVVVEGETYMVDSNQNIYDEFNKIIGKYDNGVVVINA